MSNANTFDQARFDARLAPYRAAATKAGWTAKQFELACDQAGDEQGLDDDAFFTALADFVDGSMPCSYWK